jgi:hypothetical protein
MSRLTADSLDALYHGPLGHIGGVAVLDHVPDPAIVRALALEAHSAYLQSSRQECADGNDAEGRGGVPRRALRTAGGGPVQDALYASEQLHALLSAHCGAWIVPSGNRGSYSYYVEPGDFLDLHLDVDACDVTLITVLQDDTDPREPAGGLVVYPHALGARLSRVRAAPDMGAALVKAQAGQSILILGGLVPHRVEPIADRGPRIISALCFRATAAPSFA